MAEETAVFAEGIADYVALFRQTAPSTDMEVMRLFGDMTAGRFAQGLAVNVRRFDTSIAAPGREIAVRVYDPAGNRASEELRPAICYFHGGGFALGSVQSLDLATAALAEATGAVLVSVEYRRLPDSDYPAAQADCDEAFGWLARRADMLGVDPARIAVSGDSAGALLAFCCAANARDAGGTVPVCQLLFYGTFAMDPDRPAYKTALDPNLVVARIHNYIALYKEQGGGPAPVDRTDLAGLPPAHIVAAQYDPLCEEAGEFADRLRAAGVPVTHHVAPGMIHGFLRAIGVSPPARDELTAAAQAIRPLLWPDRTGD
ncbi:alpha/beta hydrolase [Sphingobium nicotianae]|uniref:Alpha/beta hydrolase n=1 Tax=Sphingobium nicotianae TaxID=2782607 RepID=A0A9X1DC78_9SPHN|nr:alpha/beta hydrolase [Sphingobium nicotianae]MBT2187331.1 alpha/beta hydrolase [Sphingobium nicotianae]